MAQGKEFRLVDYYVGTSGWHYQDWRGRFYPEDLPAAKWLEFYARQFATVELNNSFYRLPSEAAFANWAKVTQANFTFAVKVSRYITHIKRLKDTEQSVDKFFSRARLLGEKLGPLLYQLPPGMRRNDEVLESFLATLPAGMKHVFEFRHQSWLDEGVFRILRRRNIGFCVFDMPDARCPVVATADFAYVRFHGSASLYSSSYSDEELAAWAKKLGKLAGNLKALYVYFNNDVQGFALENARTFISYLKNQSLSLDGRW